jgi:hypothetical protein
VTESPVAGLVAALEQEAAVLEDVVRSVDGPTIELRRGERPFARLGPAAVEFRLGEPVATAALRTRDTTASPLGPDWVRFGPAEVDRFARDRASSWLELAWRRAIGPA